MSLVRRPRLLATATTVAVTLALAGCGDDAASTAAPAPAVSAAAPTATPPAPPAATSAEPALDAGKLIVYSGRNENLVQPVLDAFAEQTGIETSVRYAGSPELAVQLLEEGERTDADVFFSQDAGALGALGKTGRLAPLAQAQLDQVPASYRADGGEWVGISGRARVLAYDPRQVPEGQLPGSVFDLTGPEWTGKLGIAPTNASFQSFVTAMRVLEGDERTAQWLQGIQDNDVQTYDNNNAVLDAVDRGEVKGGLINHYYWYEKAEEVGADNVNAQLHYLGGEDPGALVNVAGVGVLAGTDRPAEAARLVDYLLSAESQRYFSEQTHEYPLVAGVAPSDALEPLSEVGAPPIDLSDLDTLDQTLAMLSDAGLV